MQPVGFYFNFIYGKTNYIEKKNLLLSLLQIASASASVSDIYPSVPSLHILLSAIFPYPSSCTIATTDSSARPGNLVLIN